MKKPLLISTYDQKGGAARAAFRLHRALVSKNINSYMQVVVKESDDWRVIGPNYTQKLKKLVLTTVEEQFVKLQMTNNPILHSPSRFGILKAKQINKAPSDIIHLHWTCQNGLSIREIANITKPVIWTLHDMWAFSGAEHYSDEVNARWQQGYTKANKATDHRGIDIDRLTWLQKQKLWTTPRQIVTPSRWLADCVKKSTLMHNWPVKVIPNVLDTKTFKPLSQKFARAALNLPETVKLVLFGAIKGTALPIKGWDLLESALTQLGNTKGIEAVIFGQSEPKNLPKLGLLTHWMGHLHDDNSLALLYSAADVMVVPSRQEAFGQTASEAQACGCPVVAFNATGLKDIVVHKKTGYLAEPYSTKDLANGINWILENSENHKRLSKEARKRAVDLWSANVVVPQYVEAYKEAIELHRLHR